MSTKKLTRSHTDRWLGGVAAGLANYFGIDSLIARVIWIIFFMTTGGTATVFYAILWFIMPVDDGAEPTVDAFDPEEIVVEDLS